MSNNNNNNNNNNNPSNNNDKQKASKYKQSLTTLSGKNYKNKEPKDYKCLLFLMTCET